METPVVDTSAAAPVLEQDGETQEIIAEDAADTASAESENADSSIIAEENSDSEAATAEETIEAALPEAAAAATPEPQEQTALVDSRAYRNADGLADVSLALSGGAEKLATISYKGYDVS